MRRVNIAANWIRRFRVPLSFCLGGSFHYRKQKNDSYLTIFVKVESRTILTSSLPPPRKSSQRRRQSRTQQGSPPGNQSSETNQNISGLVLKSIKPANL